MLLFQRKLNFVELSQSDVIWKTIRDGGWGGVV